MLARLIPRIMLYLLVKTECDLREHNRASRGLQSVRHCYTNGRYSVLSLDFYVVDVLMRDLVAHDRRPAAFLVYLWLAKEEQRRGGQVQVSYGDLAESVGVSRSSAQAAVGWLARRKLLAVRKETSTSTPRYAVLQPWR